MRRQRKQFPKSRPMASSSSSPGSMATPTQARMEAYWSPNVMREDWYLPWVNRPPESLRRQRSLSIQPVHSCDTNGMHCLQHYQQQYSPNPNIHLRAKSFDEGRKGRLNDLHYQQQHYFRMRRQMKGSQRSNGSSTNDDYGFLSHSHRISESIAANTTGEDRNNNAGNNNNNNNGNKNSSSNIYYNGKERISSISDCDEEDDDEDNKQNILLTNSTTLDSPPTPDDLYGATEASGYSTSGKRSTKLKRRKAYYREKKEGRSRSLTHIDHLDPAMLLRNEDMDSKSEPDTSLEQLLFVPGAAETRESRRKKLARSQVSSSEFFSVCFEGELGSGLEEFLPVTRGTCLGDALRPLFEKKNINFTCVNVFVDSSKTPLPTPATTDTYFVAGKNLIVRAKEVDSKFHSRSFKQPSRKPSNRTKNKFFSSSTEDANYLGSPNTSAASLDPSSPVPLTIGSGSPSTIHPHGLPNTTTTAGAGAGAGSISHEGSLKVKSTKHSNRWSGLFSNSIKDNSKMDLLVEQLNTYSKNGIPEPVILTCDTDDFESNYTIEEDWRGIVSGWSDMSERVMQQQTAIWELVATEVVYLRTIKVITDLFLACLYNLQAANILNEIDRDQLFSNIPLIYKSNKLLWLDCILPMVEKARDTKMPLQPSELRTGFLRFGSTCQPYTRYCLDQTKCQQYCREKYQENELFKAYLAWCETRKECNRLRLMDILVRPMQRMTKYSLLLKAILKHTEELEQRKCLEEMILSVERFVKSVNGALRSRQDAERLQGIAERIENYEIVETREDELESVIKSHSKLDLFHPMPGCGTRQRWLQFESDMKMKDSFTSKMDAHCFLFTDMLLVCKPAGRKGEKMKVIRQPYVIDRLIPRELSKDPCAFGLVYLNEYGTASAAFTLHFHESKLVKMWLEHIKKGQKVYKEYKEKENMDYNPEVEDDETGGMMYLSSRSPRGGSSRASQLSSLVHSHSGSIEMNEASAISSRGVSFEHELRGSSLSSDDGNGNDASGNSLIKSRSVCTEQGPGRPISPRLLDRFSRSKSPTPNTLTVQIPVPNLSGQSLPNLTTASESSLPTYSLHSLTVPKSLLSPTHRGISYPPPSPRSLRRSHALLQSRNPPLQKAKKITSPENHNAASLDVHVPEFRGVTPPSNDVSPVTQSSSIKFSPETPRKKEYSQNSNKLEDDVHILHSNPDFNSSENPTAGSGSGIAKRLARNDRPDAKRYYTTGAIEDIKKENNKDKDSTIHKRLSWNYGPHQQQQAPMSADPLRNRQFFSSESMASIRSSSGVSSTSSLLHCVSDLEPTLEHLSETNHPDVRIAVSEPEPESPPGPEINPVNPEDDLIDFHGHSNHIEPRSTTNGGNIDDTTTTHKSNSNKKQHDNIHGCEMTDSPESSSSKVDLLLMRNFILSDSSIEVSEV